MTDITALGELLIDFTPAGTSENGNVQFEQNPGGAPANVLAALAKLQKKTAFIGKVGQDQFGSFLKEVLEKINVNTEGLVISREVNTTLAFVHLDDNGDRAFSFYRNPGADMMLKEDEIDLEMISNSKIFHFGSLSLTHEPARSATFKAVRHAKTNGCLISYDPNLRELLWDSLELAKEMMLEGMKYADVVKISEEELEFLTGMKDMESATQHLHKEYNIPLLFVTLGSEGCFYRCGEITGKRAGYDVQVVDTTGAGDAFLAGALYQILERNGQVTGLEESELQEIVRFANAVGAIATTKKGAIPSLPTLDQVLQLM